jgi:hypothetical protein
MKYLLLILLFTSCISEKELTNQCADKFIIKDSIVYVERYDTIYEASKIDTTILWDSKYIIDTLEIKKIKRINKYIDKIVYRENVAKIEMMKKEKDELVKDAEQKNSLLIKLNERIKTYNTIRNIVISIIILAIFFSIYIKTISKKWL